MKTEKKNSDIPVWGVIVFISTTLLGCVGWSWGAVQAQAVSKVNDLAIKVESVEARIRTSELSQESVIKDIEYMKRDISEILSILKVLKGK